jgi:hypothetical protein
MKTFIKYLKYIVTGLTLSITLSCSDDFLHDNPVPYISNFDGFNPYTIYISPEWETNEYQIYYPGAGNVKFSVSSAPEWLNITNISGQFVNDMASVTCNASFNSGFSAPGFYNAPMILDIEGTGKFAILVCYINEGNPEIAAEFSDMSFEYGYTPPSLNITNKGEGVLIWEITDYPKWLEVDASASNNVLLYYERASVTLNYNPSALLEQPSQLFDKITGNIVITSNDKKRSKTVVEITLNPGNPMFDCANDVIDFGRTDTQKTFSIGNYDNGILIWQIDNCPDWITFSPNHGYMLSYNYGTELTVTCDRSKLPAGQNSATVTFKTNDPRNPSKQITVKCWNGSANSENIKGIAGTVTDAWFDKDNDLLYLSTKQPNHLLVYDAKTKAVAHEITLENAPACFSMSGDKRRIAVGHEGKISFIDVNQHVVEKTVEVETIVFDIEWGDNEWCCYIPGQSAYNCNLKWINVVSGEKYESSERANYYLYGGSIIKKVPNQNYILALSSHVIVCDTQTREYVNSFSGSFNSGIWFSSDGSYFFDAYYKNVYRTSALTAQNVLPIAQLKLNDSYQSIQWIDHNPATNSLWAARQNYSYNSDAVIWQLEANDYTVVNTLYYDDYYLATVNGVYAEYPVTAYYVFANSEGSEIMVIKNLMEQGNAWSIEHIAVN